MRHVERVPAARVIHVVASVVCHEPVIGRVVNAVERQRRAKVVALCGVVLDDIENDLQARGMEGSDHRPELAHRLRRAYRGGVSRLKGKIRQAVVTPIIGQPALKQMPILHEMVHGH